ncbi:MAG: sigma 54-interacting transcriptional regulator, partial [Acidobacteria bacterium]|nr:sigma 54-interacting transcriptional regulator [Acidobacteriota bacterium]
MSSEALSFSQVDSENSLRSLASGELTFNGNSSLTEPVATPSFLGVVGQSSGLRNVLQLAKVVAATSSTVLLLGETGTGKELIARAIHERSQRQQRPFVTLNCAAIPSSLFESELFGHERGAFTGANMQRAGRLELADRGT